MEDKVDTRKKYIYYMTDQSVMNDKRKLILKSAKKVFAKSSYKDASIEEVAHNAGVAKGTVYNYFKDKDELFIEVIASIIEKTDELVENAVKEEGGLWDKIEYLTLESLKYFSEKKQIFMILRRETPFQSIRKQEGTRKIKKLMESRMKKLEKIFSMHRKDNLIREDFSDRDAAFLCMNSVEGMVRRMLEGWEKNPEKNSKLLVKFIKNGISKNE